MRTSVNTIQTSKPLSLSSSGVNHQQNTNIMTTSVVIGVALLAASVFAIYTFLAHYYTSDIEHSETGVRKPQNQSNTRTDETTSTLYMLEDGSITSEPQVGRPHAEHDTESQVLKIISGTLSTKNPFNYFHTFVFNLTTKEIKLEVTAPMSSSTRRKVFTYKAKKWYDSHNNVTRKQKGYFERLLKKRCCDLERTT